MKQKVDHVFDADNVPTNKQSSQGESQLYIFEDNEAVIKMIIQGRCPTMRHVSRTKELLLIGWFFHRIHLEPKIHIKYVDTKNQLADILTKRSFSRDDWHHFLCSFNIVCFSMFFCSHFSNFLSDVQVGKQRAMSKRGQKTPSNEGSPTAKAMPSGAARGKGVRTSLHEIWDLWSIRWMLMKGKKSLDHPGNWSVPTQVQKSDFASESTREFLLKQAGNWCKRVKT